ncbi:hypothetical protein A8M77_22930 [Variovorax sp. JS1663]|nr:hypothetical protein A8M77_22930 [Variovorax sp. JS1663]
MARGSPSGRSARRRSASVKPERLARECVRIAWDRGIGDDGHPAGERHGDRIYEPTTKAPKFDPFSLDVNWKALESDLMARILDLHGELAHLKHQVAGMVDNDPFPYDGAYFPHRRLWSAEFAERVVCISRDVRESLGIKLVHPTRFADLQDDCVEALDAARQEKERYEERRAEQHQKVMAVQEAIEAEEARKKAAKQAPTDA